MRTDHSTDAVAALVRGDHGDPFSILGMHVDRGVVAVRTFQPQAERVEVLDAGSGEVVAELPRVHPDGFFSGPVRGRDERFAYRLRLHRPTGSVDVDDPYRFGSTLGELDLHLWGEGMHLRAYEKLGAHAMEMEGVTGTAFAVWAPSARRVSVVGEFNDWDGRRHPMRLHPGVGIWEIFVPGIGEGTHYKYEIKGRNGELLPLKADPFGFYAEQPPRTASIVHPLGRHTWRDEDWLARRAQAHDRAAPISIYEVHIGSWMRVPEEGNRYLTYRELADRLVPYVRDMGYTHIEMLPITEHPFDGSWGYQPIGLYAPTSRHGTPDDFAYFVDACHQAGIGLLLDWVPGHFPTDPHGLGYFDGTHLYEHADPRQGFHMDWNTLIYNFGRNEVRNFLVGNALFWLDHYHLDGVRVDAVASMLYLDYSRTADQWVPNKYGGRENLEAIDFLRQTNEQAYGNFPGIVTIAEESTAWPGVSRPAYVGGLGFGYKWNMGWMHDTLSYIGKEPIHRRYHHHELTFGLLYAFSENFVLPLSHDEVVHGKGSILARMPGDAWQQFANLRAYYGFMWGHPGKKLLFMGQEFAQGREWNHNNSLDWHLLDVHWHKGVQDLVRDLNGLYRSRPAMHELDCEPEGFEWVESNDSENSVLSFLRFGKNRDDVALVVCNFTPVPREGYRVGVPGGGQWREVLNTDAAIYGGSNRGNGGEVTAEETEAHGRPFSLSLTLPPLATIVLEPVR